jgi:hypothetical protein
VRTALTKLSEDKVRHVAAAAQEALAELEAKIRHERPVADSAVTSDVGKASLLEKEFGWLQRLLHGD